MNFSAKSSLLIVVHVLFAVLAFAQAPGNIKWSKDGNSYYTEEKGDIVQSSSI